VESLDLTNFRNIFQDTHVNFLIGSGASKPYLETLNNIEVLSDQVRKLSPEKDVLAIVDASLYASFFNDVVVKNVDIKSHREADSTLQNYRSFLSTINRLVSINRNPLIAKQVNLFTTNVDVCIETASDDLSVEINDGFTGRLSPSYRLDNYRTRLFKLTLHYDNSAEIPVFNLFKMHGSLTWLPNGGKILLDQNLKMVTAANEALVKIPAGSLLEIEKSSKPSDLVNAASSLNVTGEITAFIDAYNELAIVNPSKDKFEKTVMQQAYYDLLRQYSNELEREASSLFVIGFSFADEHIRSLTVRAANSNPTLIVYVFCHSENTKLAMEETFEDESFVYDNVRFISPDDIEVEDITIDRLNLETITEILQYAINPHENETDPKVAKTDEQAES